MSQAINKLRKGSSGFENWLRADHERRKAEEAGRGAQTGVVATVTPASAPAAGTLIPARPIISGNPREPAPEAGKAFRFEDPLGIL